jgi:hypothetical protein
VVEAAARRVVAALRTTPQRSAAAPVPVHGLPPRRTHELARPGRRAPSAVTRGAQISAGDDGRRSGATSHPRDAASSARDADPTAVDRRAEGRDLALLEQRAGDQDGDGSRSGSQCVFVRSVRL